MKKEEMIKVLSKELGTTQKAEREFWDDLDRRVEIISESMTAGERTKLGEYINLKRVEVKGRNCKLNGQEYQGEDREEIKVTRTEKLKKILG